jgi:hypothetical protein
MQVLWGECISGALYVGDFMRLAQKVGFVDPRSLSSAPITVNDPELQDILGEARFSSITYRCDHRPACAGIDCAALLSCGQSCVCQVLQRSV